MTVDANRRLGGNEHDQGLIPTAYLEVLKKTSNSAKICCKYMFRMLLLHHPA